ncbi:MAG: cbb3-type cytochrome oxidase assembly protein CcoS [Leptospirales bacterium]|jgi:cbb3-type cytochrome oxidase maturation protein
MEIIGVLLFLATAVGMLFLGIFFWAYRGRQFDDIESPARRMLFDTDAPHQAPEAAAEKTSQLAGQAEHAD